MAFQENEKRLNTVCPCGGATLLSMGKGATMSFTGSVVITCRKCGRTYNPDKDKWE